MTLPPAEQRTEATSAPGTGSEDKGLRDGWRLSNGERFRYYLGTVGYLISANILTAFLSIFLVFQGMSLAAVGGLILVIKLIDAADDLAFGFIVDRLNPARVAWLRRFAGEGKYLPWYRITFVGLPIATILFFVMPSGMPDLYKIIWFGVAYLLYDLASTLSQVPMGSMIMTLTDNVRERDAILRTKGLLTVFFLVAFALVVQFLISEFVGLSLVSVAVGCALIAFVAMLPLARGVTEHNTELKNAPADAAPKYTLGEMWRAVRTNRFVMLIFGGGIVRGLAATQQTTGMFAAFFLFDNSMILTVPVLIGLLPALALQFFANRVVRVIGKRNTVLIASAIPAALGFLMFAIGAYDVTMVLLFMTLTAIPNGLIAITESFMLPDTIEYTRYKTGQDCAGIFYAMQSFVEKAAGGVSNAFAMFFLALGGWVEVNATDFADLAAQGVTQPPSALTALWMTISLIPAIGMLIYVALMALYRLRDKDARLMAKCNSGEITREECEAQLSRSY